MLAKLIALLLFVLVGSSTLKGINDVDYTTFKREMKKEWAKEKIATPSIKWVQLADRVNSELKQEQPLSMQALHAYNYLRELLELPRARSIDEIDRAWFAEILPEIELFSLIGQYHQWQLPTEAQKQLVEEASHQIGLSKKVYAAQHEEDIGGGAVALGDHGFVAVCQNPDSDTRLFTVYHELGHLVHKDPENGKLFLVEPTMDSTGKLVQIAPRVDPTIIDKLLDDEAFKKDVTTIAHTLERGIQAVPSLQETSIGKELARILADSEVQQVLKRYHSFWVPPSDANEQKKVKLLRGYEQRADLFAFEQLLKQNSFGPMLTMIYYGFFADKNQQHIIRESEDGHPSGAERALYLIGLLVENGIDVPKVFKQWEQTGVCKTEEKLDIRSLFKSLNRLHVENMFNKSLTEKSVYYERKKRVDKDFAKQAFNSQAEKKFVMAFSAYINLSDFDKNPTDPHKAADALFAYNYLRDYLSLPMVESVKDINRRWLYSTIDPEVMSMIQGALKKQ